MSAHDGAKPASLFLDGPVAASHQRGLDLLELGRLAFLDRSPPDREVSVPPLRAVMHEARKSNVSGFPRPRSARCWAANRPKRIRRVFSSLSASPNLVRRCCRSRAKRSAAA